MIIIIFNINYLLDILNHFLYTKILLNKNSLEKIKNNGNIKNTY